MLQDNVGGDKGPLGKALHESCQTGSTASGPIPWGQSKSDEQEQLWGFTGRREPLALSQRHK